MYKRQVLYLGKQDLGFLGHHEDLSSINRRKCYKELLETFVEISSVGIQEHYQSLSSLAFIGLLKMKEFAAFHNMLKRKWKIVHVFLFSR